MKTRLKQLRKTLNLTQGEFGKKIGMSDVAISYMESGRTAINAQNVNLVCLTFGVSEQWLRSGEGEMFVDDDPALADILETFRKLSPFSQDVIITLAHTLLEKERLA
ncbi:MAG: helix-turn-helix transcriptional regulator, partial [Treponema sp.]|nr:helix-turn-helix transcriptional regulator [Treponema sp.]